MSLLTVLHTAEASKAIYKNNDFTGYTLLGGFFDPKNDDRLGWKTDKKTGDIKDGGGGSAGIYRCNAMSSHYILAFRGSKGAKDWKVDDVQIGLNQEVDRASDCINWVRGVQAQYGSQSNAFFMVTGHSLGGFLAQVIGVVCNLPFITYNAPPAGRALAQNPAASRFRMGVNIRINWDPVSRAPGKHIGPLVTLPHVGMKIYDAHTSAAFMKSVERAPFRDHAAMSYIYTKNT